MKVGFVGLGAMGGAMAANLLKGVQALTVYNRTQEKAEPLVARGAVLARTPAEAARGDIVISMLADDAAVQAVVFGGEGLLAALPPGAIHISMSTISFALAERLATARQDSTSSRHQCSVDPRRRQRPSYSSSPRGSRSGFRVPATFRQRTFVIAAEAPKATLVKLSGNFLIASVIECLGEAFALTSKAGIDREAYLEILTNTLFGSPVYKTYGELIARERYTAAGFKVGLGYKDIHLALDAAETLAAPMPVASFIHDRFLAPIASGAGDLDWSALAGLAERDAGRNSPMSA
jgi:3-hydroxyisobutyrate dehydrogenase-like beta-hydroxyacid dehydrogenase